MRKKLWLGLGVLLTAGCGEYLGPIQECWDEPRNQPWICLPDPVAGLRASGTCEAGVSCYLAPPGAVGAAPPVRDKAR